VHTSSYRQHLVVAKVRKMTAIFIQTALATALDPDLAFMPGTSLVVTLVMWANRCLGDVDVLKASEDAQPRGTIVVGKHRPQAMPTSTLLKLEHDAKVRLVPVRLLGPSGIKRLVTHPNRGASVDGQVHIGLTAALGEHPL